jgi:SET family sugar efflux transporter-like MFS transporter
VRRLLVPSAALLWGLQFAFLNPALALLLVTLFDATPDQVGTVLAVYNASGFVASLVLPAYADAPTVTCASCSSAGC